MYLPAALEARESILGLYRTRTERMHAILHFLLSGLERGERLFTVLDERSERALQTLLASLEIDPAAARLRGMPAESLTVAAPWTADEIVNRVAGTAMSWRGRPAARPVRVVVDLHYILVALRSHSDIIELSQKLRETVAERSMICLCLLFSEHVPQHGLGTFLQSFSRIAASPSFLSGRPDAPPPPRPDRSGELDAVLERLILSDEAVIGRTAAGVERRLDELDARAFLRVAGDGFLILDQHLTIEYASPSLTKQIHGGEQLRRGVPLATFFSTRAYNTLESAFDVLSSEGRKAGEPLARIITMPFAGPGKDRVFEASVTTLVALERVVGFACVLRGVIDETSADTGAESGTHTDDGSRRLAGGAPRRLSSHGARAWRVLPRRIVEGRSVTDREAEILEHTLNGRTVAEISEHLCIAEVTVKKHRENGYLKLGIHDRLELYRLADTGR